MRHPVWFASLILGACLLVPVLSQSNPVPAVHDTVELEKFTSGSDGETEVVLRSVRVRKQGGHYAMWSDARQEWDNVEDPAQIRRILLFERAVSGKDRVLSLEELLAWVPTAKIGEVRVGYVKNQYDTEPLRLVERTSGGISTLDYDFRENNWNLDPFVKYLGESQKVAGYQACKANVKNLGTALEMYSTDYEGHYPPSLSQLTPNYLKVIMQCPMAHKDTYSATYEVNSNPDRYTLHCQGDNHHEVGLQPNYPMYSSEQGLIEH